MQCVVTECSAAAGACDADPACKTEKDCVLACPPKNSHEVDEDCAEACSSTSALIDDFWDCFGDAIDDACEVPCD
jgi:hypothetical protein